MLFVVLSTLFLTNTLIAEFIGAKVIALGELMPFLKDLPGMGVGVLIWPVVFVLSDIINEYFGPKGVKRISYIGAFMIAYAFFIIYISTKLTPSPTWLDKYSVDYLNRPLDIDYAYSQIFQQGGNLIIASIIAFVVGQLVDAYTFRWIRKITQHKMLWLRATGSTVVSQLIDSFLILYIGFCLLGPFTLKEVLLMGVTQYLYKITIAAVLTPLIYVAHFIIEKYLGKKQSEELIGEAYAEAAQM